MKKLVVLLCGMLLALPAFADEVPDDEAVVEEPAPEEAAPAEEAPAEEAPVEETAETEEAPAEESSDDPFYLYVGLDRADIEVSFSDPTLQQQFGCVDCGSRFYKARVGTRVFDVIGLEAQIGQADTDGDNPGDVEVDQYVGLFVVPTGSFLDVVEFAVPVGYSMMTLARPGASHDFDRLSFGLNVEVPIIIMSSWVPEIRVGGGGMVYQAENDARVYGFHFGFRLDFLL